MRFRKYKDYPFPLEKLHNWTIFSMKSVFNSGLLKIQIAFQYSAYGKWKMDLFLNKIRFKFGN